MGGGGGGREVSLQHGAGDQSRKAGGPSRCKGEERKTPLAVWWLGLRAANLPVQEAWFDPWLGN